MKNLYLFFSILLLLSVKASFSQQTDTLVKPKTFHDASSYIDIQFPKGDKPLITSQLWIYIKKAYLELRYNYEDRETFSLYAGRSFKVGKNDEVDIIPMVGLSLGKFRGVSSALTTVLEGGWIRGFTQNQYSFNLKDKHNNFFFDWSAIVIKAYKPIYLGISLQTFALENIKPQIYFAPMVSVKGNHIIIEGFVYNFWNLSQMWAVGIQYLY